MNPSEQGYKNTADLPHSRVKSSHTINKYKNLASDR